MKRVKIFSMYNCDEILERQINEFIEDKEVVNISYTECCSDEHGFFMSALVLYEEE